MVEMLKFPRVPLGLLYDTIIDQVAGWEDEVARLQDASDQLLEFRGKLYMYSDRVYMEALSLWEDKVST